MSKGSEHIEDLERFRNRKEEVQRPCGEAVTKARCKTQEKEPSEASANTWKSVEPPCLAEMSVAINTDY